jgi:pyroglutamyl-peptidase
MKILVTGFEAFGENSINPSQIMGESLPDSYPEGIEIKKATLPVDKKTGPAALIKAFDYHKPDAVLCFGLALGRKVISLERVAINLMDYRIPDNAGVSIHDQPIVKDGPAAYFSTLPIRAMLAALKSAGIPAELSLTAGAYLCNQIFYTLMHTIHTLALSIPAGFVHLPALPEQAALAEKPIPSMGMDVMYRTAEILIKQLSLPLKK